MPGIKTVDMLKLLRKFIRSPDCIPFLEPVDWESIGLSDYPEIIERPMDLGTVKRNLERGQYKEMDTCANDVRQVWTNCLIYNSEDSDFYALASILSDRFERAYLQLCRRDLKEEDIDGVPSVDRRSELCDDISRVDNGLDRKLLIEFIQSKAPHAVMCLHAEGEVQINLDSLSASLFREVQRKARGFISKKKKNQKRKYQERIVSF
jgi:hypothetical protein